MIMQSCTRLAQRLLSRRAMLSSLVLCLVAPGAFGQAHTLPPVSVGLSGCFTHPVWSKTCNQMAGGIEVAIDEFNAKGGGRKVTLKKLDDHYDLKQAVSNARTFGQDPDVVAMVGLMGGALTAASLPELEANKLPAVGGTTGTAEARAPSRYMFHVRASYAAEVEKLIDQLRTVGRVDIAIVYPTSPFGKSIANTVQELMTKKGLRPAAVLAVDADKPDFGPVVAKLAPLRPSALLSFLSADQLAAYLQAAKSAGVAAQAHTISVMGAKSLHDKAGDLARGVVISQVMPSYDSARPIAQAYRAAMQKGRPGEALGYLSFEGYVSARVLLAAIQKAGPGVTRERVRQALMERSGVDLNGFKVEYRDDDMNGSRFVDITQIGSDGRIVR